MLKNQKARLLWLAELQARGKTPVFDFGVNWAF